jgi:hypothetical protein
MFLVQEYIEEAALRGRFFVYLLIMASSWFIIV